MKLKKIFYILELTSLVTFVMYLASIFVPILSLTDVMKVFSMITVLTLVSCYSISSMIWPWTCLFSTYSDTITILKNIVSGVGVMGSSILLCGVIYILNAYPGGNLMKWIGFIMVSAALIILVVLILSEKGPKPPYAINLGAKFGLVTLNFNRMVVRFVVILALTLLADYLNTNCFKYLKTNNFADFISECDNYTETEKNIATAWFVIDRGQNRENTLKLYGLTEDVYNANVARVVYGRDELPKSQNRTVIVNPSALNDVIYNAQLYDIYDDRYLFDVKTIVQPEDTLYLDSLMPVFSKDYSPVMRRYYYLELIARHTQEANVHNLLEITNLDRIMDKGGVDFR